MAHKGKYYPVHFRRDFNADGDIRSISAFPAGWLATLHSGVAPPYVVDGAVFALQSIPQVRPEQLRWTSDIQRIAGWDWRLSAFVRFSNLPDTILIAEWKLDRIDRGLVSHWQPNPGDRVDPFRVAGSFSQVLFTDFTVFPAGANFNFSRTDPIGY